MHIFIGGAYNGKRAYVKEWLEQHEVTEHQWFESELPRAGTSPIVIAGIENWLAETDLSEECAIEHVFNCCKNRAVIFILTDIGRGIVPIDHNQRRLRDYCGRLNQRLFSEAKEVTRIWYGLPQTLKGGTNDDENLYENRR